MATMIEELQAQQDEQGKKLSLLEKVFGEKQDKDLAEKHDALTAHAAALEKERDEVKAQLEQFKDGFNALEEKLTGQFEAKLVEAKEAGKAEAIAEITAKHAGAGIEAVGTEDQEKEDATQALVNRCLTLGGDGVDAVQAWDNGGLEAVMAAVRN